MDEMIPRTVSREIMYTLRTSSLCYKTYSEIFEAKYFPKSLMKFGTYKKFFISNLFQVLKYYAVQSESDTINSRHTANIVWMKISFKLCNKGQGYKE